MPPSFHRRDDGTVFRVGDTVLVKPEGGGNDYIAEITEIKEQVKGSDYKLDVVWFYRPEEVVGGRKMFHGKREVFRSDHHDIVEAGTIKRKCQILNLEDYQKLPRPVKEDTFFSRCLYQAKTKRFKPDKFPVFCVCNMPYNPDIEMMQCVFCKEYFHTHCMEAAGHLKPGTSPEVFDCGQCRSGWQTTAA